MYKTSNNVVASQIDQPALAVAPPIHIYTLGTLQVVRDAQAVSEGDWHTRQARQLLKILITERPRPVSTDRLIEILWPTSTPEAAATTLRSAINALRNVLEPERLSRAPSTYILTQTPGYVFPGHANIWLDVAVFEQVLNQAAQSADRSQRQKLLEAALELYQDDYLTSDPYADWLQSERERLRERFFDTLLQWAELQAAAGRHATAIAACRRILARDEVRESAYQALMRYQAEVGDSAAALLTYERCRTILAEELGADPSPLTQQWHQRILNGEIQPQPQSLRLPAESAAGPASTHYSPTGQHGQLPFAAPISLPQSAILPALSEHFFAAFVGREGEIAQLTGLRQAAFAGKGGLALLEGEAGVGKTRLAWHVLQQAVAAGSTVISAACQPLERQLPFAPLADSMGRYVDSLSTAALPALPAASLAQLAQIIPSLHDRLPDLPALPGDGLLRSDDDRQRLIDGLVAFITALARARPLVFLLDDLQWADADTLAVLGRLAARLADLPILLLLAYRSDDLAENEALATLRHTLRRTQQPLQVKLERLTPDQVHAFVQAVLGQEEAETRPAAQRDVSVNATLATSLYTVTQGNALFMTEALRDLLERQAGEAVTNGESVTLQRNQRVQEIILERIGRLPATAQAVLRVAAAIGRDFSLELLEGAALEDPATGLDVLLQRKFLLERPDERLDFSHQVVRQVAYDSLNTLTRRRLHRRVADALVALGRMNRNPNELAFHYQQAGEEARLLFAEYSVLGGEFLLRNYGFRQALEVFDRTLLVLEARVENSTAGQLELIRRALQGRGLAYESLYDAAGVTAAYGRLLQWAQQQGDRQLMLTAHSRRATMLNLLGQQREGNEALRALLSALTAEQNSAQADPASRPVASRVLADLMERRQRLYRVEGVEQSSGEWAGYTLPPPPVADPVGDLLHLLGPAHAVLPLLDYGWVLLVQGQPSAAIHCLEAVVELATQTAQPSIASTALHQLAVTARMLGDWEQSQTLNEQSVAINRTMQGTAAELASMWPRTGSALLSLEMGKVDKAERRLRRVTDFLNGMAAGRPVFRSYHNSADIGLGLVALARGDLTTARRLLESGLADTANFYPYTHVRGLLGLARLAHRQGASDPCVAWLQKALHFAGTRSLLEEYVATLLVIAELHPPSVSVERLLRPTLEYVRSLGLQDLRSALEQALNL